MASLKNLFQSIALASMLVAAPAFTQQVSTDYNHSASFSKYHTYTWHHVSTTDPLYVDRIKDAVNRNLSSKGWQLAPSGADVSITAVGATQTKQEYTSFYDGLGGFGWRRGWGGGGFGQTTTTVQEIPVGTLVIDMYDNSDKKLIWRGTASDTLSNKPEKNTQKLEKAVDKMLEKFPPKGAQ